MVSRILAYSIIGIWMIFVVLFLLAHPRNVVSEVKRAPAWWVGLLFQVIAYAAVWSLSRPFGTPISHMPQWLEFALAGSAILIAAAATWMVVHAVRALGKQWAVAARVISGHELVTGGPFRIVRHPIYSGLLGMLIATALAFSTWLGMILSVAVYLAGTSMRIRQEERLLRETFGPDYEAYAREVPALVPGLF